jgi:DNA-binding CsgD family transcriptional regulator
LRLIAQLRELRPLFPVLLRVERADRNLRSLAYCQGFELAIGSAQHETLRAFVESSLARPRTTFSQLENRLADLACRYSLTPSEKRIAAASIQGLSRAELLSCFEVSINTLKSQTRSILKKTGHASLSDLSRAVLTSLLSDAC